VTADDLVMDAVIALVMDLADREREMLGTILRTDELSEEAREALTGSHDKIEELQVNLIEAMKKKDPRGRPPDKLWRN
jgi:hypothetical protein